MVVTAYIIGHGSILEMMVYVDIWPTKRAGIATLIALRARIKNFTDTDGQFSFEIDENSH